ncbi:metal-binding protein [Cellulomonas cellasea DSM 20118]|uniref:Metal-binding protein n=1 Tax=Cellulomonas cellasea DSM 20118 TaxID=1408250 RepID=A0A0A0BAE0_9CELL|nr:metal-binding protein [Cellulomonas cellasea DSM 20118]
MHREVELKFAVDDDDQVPSLIELAGPAADGTAFIVGEPEQHVLRATYYDTADLDLARHDLTLRRRVGGQDGGWHLKVPGGESERSEVRLPPGRAGSAIPEVLQRLVRARTQGRPLVPVAKITTRRTVHRLFDATDRPLLELAHDRVSARRVLPLGGSGDATGPEITWQEIEVEVLDGDEETLTAVAGELAARGLAAAPHTSKLARVLGPDGRTAPARPKKARRRPTKAPTSGVALAYVGDQLEQLRSQDLLVRMDRPGSVHKMRVATRRLRSALDTFRSSFAPDAVTALRAELRWLAGVLGEVRDAEVMHERVVGVLRTEPAVDAGPTEMVDAGPPDGDDAGPPAAGEADARLRSAHRAAREALVHELDGERYDRLLDALDDFVSNPPTTQRGSRPAGKALRRGVARQYARVRRLVERAGAATDADQRAELLHEARKAAKQTRYAAELAGDVFGGRARAFAAAMERTQELLGQHQDSVVLRQRLRELAQATTDPVAAFTYGRLHALEEVRAREAEERLPAVWSRTSKKRLRRWLR